MSKQPHNQTRFEYKYWVSEKVAAQLLRRVAPYLVCDDWAPGGQRNTSLYLDSSELDLLQLHTESTPDRAKLRVRAYGEPPCDPAFLELKRKLNRVGVKRRVAVPLASLPVLLGGGTFAAWPPTTAAERESLEQFLYLMMTYHAEPKVLITCIREAYVSVEASEGIRLTLDRQICYQPARGYTLHGDPRAWQPLCGVCGYEAGAAILVEVKFPRLAPFWLGEIVQQLGLARCSYSKYVSAMVLTELGPAGLVGLDRAHRSDSLEIRSL